jgi:anhydro-N-acetylmuramic acid kinase
MNKIHIIGLMSGTSLDGLDLAYCKFSRQESWAFEIIHSQTVSYSKEWKARLSSAMSLSKEESERLSLDFGLLMAKHLKDFIELHKIEEIDAIASHGHTVFHQPQNGITLQVGDPKPMYDVVQKPIVWNFRSQDVALGGQGAPLVPIADRLLFAEYDACLNLGGFSNISFEEEGKRIAFDICPVNIVMNILSEKLGMPYDDKGEFARSGNVDEDLLEALNQLDYYTEAPPKSLGLEWVQEHVSPLWGFYRLSVEDQLRTFVEHVAIQISMHSRKNNLNSVLITGGGAYNRFLMERLNSLHPNVWTLGSHELIEFKEAMVFAFLAYLRLNGYINVLSSVTGAKNDHVSGRIFAGDC